MNKVGGVPPVGSASLEALTHTVGCNTWVPVENTHPVSQSQCFREATLTHTSGVEKSLMRENIPFRMADNKKTKIRITAKAKELHTEHWLGGLSAKHEC